MYQERTLEGAAKSTRSLLAVLVAVAGCAPAGPGGGGSKSATSGTYSAPYGTVTSTSAPTTTPNQDDDGDGVVAAGDCDDLDPTSAPGLPELACDGRDNDCAGDGDDRAGCDLPASSADLEIPLPAGMTWSWMDAELRVHPDANGDGLPDLWARARVGEWEIHHVAWSLAGRVATVPFVDAQGPYVLFPGDVDGDGIDDMWAGEFHPLPVSGWIDATEIWTVDRGAARAGDWNGDGSQDLLTYSGGQLAWFAEFPEDDSWIFLDDASIDGHESLLEQVDIDGDGELEIVAGRFSANGYADGNRLSILEGTPGPGDWATEINDDIGLGSAAAVVDLDSDGQVDLVLGEYGPYRVFFGPIAYDDREQLLRPDLSTGYADDSSSVEVVHNFDGQGRNEVLIGCTDRVALIDFGTPGYLPEPCNAGHTFGGITGLVFDENHTFASGDLDGDGLGDIAVLDFAANTLRVWFGHPW